MCENAWMNGGFIILVFVLIALSVIMYAAQSDADQTDITRWARENRLEIDSVEKPLFDNGPFWFRGRGRRMYRIHVRDNDGTQRTVSMRAGTFNRDYRFYK